LISLLIAIAVPVAAFIVNGEVGFEFVVLGLVTGVAFWYWGPSVPPF